MVVTVGGTLQVQGAGNDYIFSNATTIQFNSGRTSGDLVVLTRSTSQSARIVDYTAGALSEADLDNDSLQALYLFQESIDLADLALTESTTVANTWDADNNKIVNVTDPTAAQDAATKNYVDTEITGAGNVPAPADPGDDDKFLRASSGTFTWQTFIASMVSNSTSFGQGVLTAANAAVGGLGGLADDNAWSGDQTLTGNLVSTETEFTIATGAIVPARLSITVDTEADAASDDLDTITVTNTPDGSLLILRAENTARSVVVKHATGNVQLAGAADFTLDTTEKYLMLNRRGTDWFEVSRSGGSGSGFGKLINRWIATDATVSTGTTTIPDDDTLPQNTEGFEVLTVTTGVLASASNRLRVTIQLHSAATNGAAFQMALFKDSDADAIATVSDDYNAANILEPSILIHEFAPGATTAVTFDVRIGPAAGTLTVNGQSGARLYGGSLISSIIVEEIQP